jgi:hypothetical protein
MLVVLMGVVMKYTAVKLPHMEEYTRTHQVS